MTSRRTVLSLIVVSGIGGIAGCSDVIISEKPAHTVSVYMHNRNGVHDVTVTIKEDDGAVVFERDYFFSDDKGSHEDATFPELTDPHTVVVTVDGKQFKQLWPEFNDPNNRCSKGNWEGIEVWIKGAPGESLTVLLTGNCQHITIEEWKYLSKDQTPFLNVVLYTSCTER
ncbi:hypothetical protein HYG81_16995 [Natrinema zhouii]|uniref:Lipoprotein n=1 Tax=Natrinema zhouii TaxID=1710539 RepID=A0A7D6CPE4_9EURY|nr:hypothetical protein [Natrinema zhouii]QLK25754.1 hypothetical protein HYG81_16995 [Natrinema zhouii]